MHETVHRSATPFSSRLTAILSALILTAACGGPAGPLHDVLDEAETRVELLLKDLEDTEDDLAKVAATELPPCPARYQPPTLLRDAPPYVDAVERPASFGDTEDSELLSEHTHRCERTQAGHESVIRSRESVRPQLEDFASYADAMRDFIDDDMSEAAIERLAGELEAIIDARPDETDTLNLRYERLSERMLDLSPLVQEMAHGANRPGARINPGNIPDRTDAEKYDDVATPWVRANREYEEARVFFGIWNDYARRIHEGPDAEDPDQAAAGWGPVTGTWTGEYARVQRDYNSDGYRVGVREQPRAVEITLDAAGQGSIDWVDSNCGGPLELQERSGASNRITQYYDGGCSGGGTVTLERTAEDRIRIAYRGSMSGEYHGEVTRE